MSKPKLPNQRDAILSLKKRIERYMLLVRGVYDTYNLEASKMALRAGYDGEKPFSFSDYPTTKNQVEKMLADWCGDMSAVIHRTTSEEWKKSNLMQDLLADKVMAYYFGQTKGKRFRKYYQTNSDALQAFQARKDYGMNLSKRIWNQSRLYKKGLEDALSVGIQKGMSAVTLSKRISKYLQDYPKLQKDYKEKYGKATDGGNCEYRSFRLARNEINLAYRTAEQKRWEQFDFIIGKEIKTSNVHEEKMPNGDICDDLAGKYPKDFLWRCWHVNCMCYEVPIIRKDYDFFAPDDAPAENEVTDVPQNYKNWVKNNAERIEKAEDKGTLPYFLKDNPEYKRYLSDEPTTLEKAQMRHEARTPEEIEDIKKRWAEHEHKNRLILNTAVKILGVAQDYGEINYSALLEAFENGNLNKMQVLTREVAHELSAIKKQEMALSDLIPDVHEWHKQFTMEELKGAHSAIEAGMGKLAGKTLAEQKKWLENEIQYVSDPSFLKPHNIHKTWKLAQDAYKAKLQDVVYEQKLEVIKKQMDVVWDWSLEHTKATHLASLLSEYNSAIANKEDFATIQQKATEAYSYYQRKIKDQEKRDAKKLAKNAIVLGEPLKDKEYLDVAQKLYDKRMGDALSGKLTLSEEQENMWDEVDKAIKDKDVEKAREILGKLNEDVDDAYSKARKDVAEWHLDSTSANDYFFDETNTRWSWKQSSDAEKKGLHQYTAGSSYITEPLRAIKGHYHYYTSRVDETEKDVDSMTSIISRTYNKHDVWIKRDEGGWCAEYRWGIPDLRAYEANPSALVGKIGTDESFMSCGSNKNAYFGTKPVILNIYCPKGTRMIYAEPFSDFGQGHDDGSYQPGKNWNGDSKPVSTNEDEIILQRGTKMKITKAEFTGGRWYIDCEVLSQNPRQIEKYEVTPEGYYCKFK